jgi:hypothetical protein
MIRRFCIYIFFKVKHRVYFDPELLLNLLKNKKMKKNFINAIVLLVVSVILPAFAYCQSKANYENYLESLPRQLKLDEKTPQKYLMITDAFDYDLSGNFIKKTRYTGEYTRGLENGNSRWNNVRISIVNMLDGAFSPGEKQEAMENFMYKSEPSKEIFSNSFFSKIPEPNIQYRNMVWDMLGFEIYAWVYFDSLKLNQEYSPKINDNVAVMQGVGTYEVKKLKLKWTGITSQNNKTCAIIQYNTLNNPFNCDYLQVIVKGCSSVWGNVYISLTDKQIEYAELFEDILMDIKIKGQENSIMQKSNRHITLNKIL